MESRVDREREREKEIEREERREQNQRILQKKGEFGVSVGHVVSVHVRERIDDVAQR